MQGSNAVWCTDRMEENGGAMPALDLPPAEIKNLEQIAKVSHIGMLTKHNIQAAVPSSMLATDQSAHSNS